MCFNFYLGEALWITSRSNLAENLSKGVAAEVAAKVTEEIFDNFSNDTSDGN